MKRIYLVRHGLSEGNISNIHQFSHTPLSDKGRSQAAFLANRFKNITLDQIVSSPFERARETAEIINTTLAKPISFDENLGEYRRPSAVWGKDQSLPEVSDLKNQIEKRWAEDWRHSDEETFTEFRSRVVKAIDNLLELDQQKILVVTHGLTIRMILAVMAFGPEVSAHEFRKLFHFFMTENTGITICEHHQYQDGRFQWKLITANDHEHLN